MVGCLVRERYGTGEASVYLPYLVLRSMNRNKKVLLRSLDSPIAVRGLLVQIITRTLITLIGRLEACIRGEVLREIATLGLLCQ